MPLPTQLLLTFSSGLLAALAARSDLRVSPKPAGASQAFVAYLLYALLVVLPTSIYFYVFHGDWYLLYSIDTNKVPSAVALLGGLCQVGLGAVGFLFGASLIRAQRDQWAGAAVGGGVSIALGLLVLVRQRLAWVGTYAQYHGDFGLKPYGETVLNGTLCMGGWLVAGLILLVYRLGWSAKRS